jgi:lysophospholipase L1-like esterase
VKGRLRFPEGRRGNLALAATSTVVTLLVLALAWELRGNFRYYRWRARFDNAGWVGTLTVASPNPALIWEYRPYGEAAGVATNRYGFRDVDYPTRDKPAGTRRIAFLGDSITVGMGVVPEDTFVRRVAKAAAAPGRLLQALNFGVDGYHALQIRELLTAKVLAFQPDQVVYVMCLNDFDFTDSSGRKISYFRKPRSFLLQDLDRAWRALRGTEFHHHHFSKHRDEVFGAILEMKRALEERQAGLLVALVPVFPEGKDGVDYFARYPLVDLHREVVAFCGRNDVPVHDLLEDFRRQPAPPDRYARDLWHLTEEGHRVVAESLLPALAPSAAP